MLNNHICVKTSACNFAIIWRGKDRHAQQKQPQLCLIRTRWNVVSHPKKQVL